ncbi:MAG: DUF2788 domain-containing protein [Neisseriaceae bacterium]|nr:DUF2788 domain-containing protein [Neisseriaceae bacterium]
MTEAEFSKLSLAILPAGLIVIMGFIIWQLAKQSQAGKVGTAVMFLALGLGITGYIFKEFLVSCLT